MSQSPSQLYHIAINALLDLADEKHKPEGVPPDIRLRAATELIIQANSMHDSLAPPPPPPDNESAASISPYDRPANQTTSVFLQKLKQATWHDLPRYTEKFPPGWYAVREKDEQLIIFPDRMPLSTRTIAQVMGATLAVRKEGAAPGKFGLHRFFCLYEGVPLTLTQFETVLQYHSDYIPEKDTPPEDKRYPHHRPAAEEAKRGDSMRNPLQELDQRLKDGSAQAKQYTVKLGETVLVLDEPLLKLIQTLNRSITVPHYAQDKEMHALTIFNMWTGANLSYDEFRLLRSRVSDQAWTVTHT